MAILERLPLPLGIHLGVVIFGEEGLESCLCVEAMRITPQFSLSTLHGGHLGLLDLLWADGLGTCCLLDLACLLHEFVQHFITQDCIIEELQVFEVFH